MPQRVPLLGVLALTLLLPAVGGREPGCPHAAARAGEGGEPDDGGALPAVDLPLQSGASLSGRVESADAQEVVLLVGPEQRRRLPWSQLAPLGVYRARAALEPPDDGPARLLLAELASELGLWAEARAEYEKAHALGALPAAAYRSAVAEAEARALAAGIAGAQRLADAGDVAAAVEAARRLKLEFGGAAGASRLDGLIEKLSARLRVRESELEKAREELERATLDVDRRKEIVTRWLQAKQRLAAADTLAAQAAAHMEKGVVSRARRTVEAADAAYVDARRDLGRLRRIAGPDEPERAEALALLAELDAKQYALLLRATKFFWDQRVFGTADEFAARASYLDPVDPELLELRRLLRESRIRRRVSEFTNAYPR